MTSPIKRADYEAARSTVKRYEEQEAERLLAKFSADRMAAQAAVDAFVPSLGDMKPYALACWKKDRADKIGRGMSEDEAVGYYLGRLKTFMAEAVLATGIDPAILFRKPD